jgi:hypothetical protein
VILTNNTKNIDKMSVWLTTELNKNDINSNSVGQKSWNLLDNQNDLCKQWLHNNLPNLLTKINNYSAYSKTKDHEICFKGTDGFLFAINFTTINCVVELCCRDRNQRDHRYNPLRKKFPDAKPNSGITIQRYDSDKEIEWYKCKLTDDNQEQVTVLYNAWLECLPINTEAETGNNTSQNSPETNSIQESQVMSSPLNQILFGPPGTGKTYYTTEAAVIATEPQFSCNTREELKEKYKKLVEKKRIRFVTFHQSYGYEEFVEGLKAETTENDQVCYKVSDGIFKSICRDAEDKPESNYVLIIDEINRGNISKIFGELITLIEDSKRKGTEEETSLSLPYSAESFSVPKNLYIIGTMNTADRSLAMIDTALRRRFDFKEMMPQPELFQNKKIKGIDLTRLLETLNNRLEVLYDREHTLGHAFMFPAYNEDDEEKAFIELQKAFKNKIYPLLEEYFYEDWNKIRLVLGDNQKQDELRFIDKQEKPYTSLFGNDHNLETYEESKVIYTRKPFDGDNPVWSNPKAYIAIYQSE